MPVNLEGEDGLRVARDESLLVQYSAKLGGWKGLRETLRAFDRDAERLVVRTVQTTADKVVGDARGRAASWARTGEFMRSIGRRTFARGVKIVSYDAAAGVLEYAHAGARSLSGRRVGTPPGAPNKAMTKAVEENQDWIVDRVDAALAQALAKVRGE